MNNHWEQNNLFDDSPTIQERFERFHGNHPIVYQELVKLSYEWRAAGHNKGAIVMFFEVLRYRYGIRGLPDPTEDFKLNNNYRSRYARLIMELNPDLVGFFEIRELQAA